MPAAIAMSSTGSSIIPPPNLEWFAIHTRSKHEKSVAAQLRCKQIDTFLPFYKSLKRWKNGQLSGQLPLFPGYLFVRIDIKKRLPVLQTAGVAKFVCVGQTPAAVPDAEINHLKSAAASGIEIAPHPFLTVGDRVRVKCGPLAGLIGIMLRHKHGLRVVLSVESISKSISIELDAADLEPA